MMPGMDKHSLTNVAGSTVNRVVSLLTAGDLNTDLERARSLAHWLDSKFEVGGVKFGLQGVVGLLPIAGDTLTTAAGFYPLLVAYRHKLGGEVVAKMVGNLAVQYGMGLVPWVGDYADVWFKANLRNLAALERAAAAVPRNAE